MANSVSLQASQRLSADGTPQTIYPRGVLGAAPPSDWRDYFPEGTEPLVTTALCFAVNVHARGAYPGTFGLAQANLLIHDRHGVEICRIRCTADGVPFHANGFGSAALVGDSVTTASGSALRGPLNNPDITSTGKWVSGQHLDVEFMWEMNFISQAFFVDVPYGATVMLDTGPNTADQRYRDGQIIFRGVPDVMTLDVSGLTQRWFSSTVSGNQNQITPWKKFQFWTNDNGNWITESYTSGDTEPPEPHQAHGWSFYARNRVSVLAYEEHGGAGIGVATRQPLPYSRIFSMRETYGYRDQAPRGRRVGVMRGGRAICQDTLRAGFASARKDLPLESAGGLWLGGLWQTRDGRYRYVARQNPAEAGTWKQFEFDFEPGTGVIEMGQVWSDKDVIFVDTIQTPDGGAFSAAVINRLETTGSFLIRRATPIWKIKRSEDGETWPPDSEAVTVREFNTSTLLTAIVVEFEDGVLSVSDLQNGNAISEQFGKEGSWTFQAFTS